MFDPLLLTAARVSTFVGNQHLTNASGFYFERDGHLHLVTSRHVVIDEANEHFPDRLEIELHIDADNLADSTGFSIPLYRDGKSVWREGRDGGGEVDIAVLALERDALPDATVYRAFTPGSLAAPDDHIEIGRSLLAVGFPLGFHDTLHHMPVARQATLSSSFGLRFQGQGYFLTDARTHRGMSGAPVVMRSADKGDDDLPWTVLGVHSARMDMGTRDLEIDEALGLNVTWYADILLTLTDIEDEDGSSPKKPRD